MLMIGILWLIFCAIVSWFADTQRERNGFGWFFAALFFSPLVAFVLLVVLGTNPKKLRKCPACAEKVRREANVCKHCGHDLPPLPTRPKQQFFTLGPNGVNSPWQPPPTN
jgi:zinc-ribbon domain